MTKTKGFRFIMMGLLTLAMCLPLIAVSDIINERSRYRTNTIAELGREWGGAQMLVGPFLVLPVEERKMVEKQVLRRHPVTGASMRGENGQQLYDIVEVEKLVRSTPLYVLPKTLVAQSSTATEIRARGIFDVPVYRAKATLAFVFDAKAAARFVGAKQSILWDQARIEMGLSSNRGLRGDVALKQDGKYVPLSPRADGAGISAVVGDPRNAQNFNLSLDLNGADSLYFTAAGQNSQVTLTSDWPHPSFRGAFLPDSRDVNDAGFTASWHIPHMARSLPQVSRVTPEDILAKDAKLGFRFYQPNDFYKQAYRAAQYGILFIGLTFLTMLLIERAGQPVHAVQYLLVGLAQAVFVLLLVSFAEQIGMTAAYGLAAVATIALITAYGFFGLALGKRAWGLCAALSALYLVLYLILQSTDYALLAGSILCFGAIGLTMFLTREQDWAALTKLPERPASED